jgi:hypothetical protein
MVISPFDDFNALLGDEVTSKKRSELQSSGGMFLADVEARIDKPLMRTRTPRQP